MNEHDKIEKAEVTPEMLRVGAAILEERRSLNYETAEEVVEDIFMAMNSVRESQCHRQRR